MAKQARAVEFQGEPREFIDRGGSEAAGVIFYLGTPEKNHEYEARFIGGSVYMRIRGRRCDQRRRIGGERRAAIIAALEAKGFKFGAAYFASLKAA